MRPPLRRQIKHFQEPGDVHELAFSTYRRQNLLTNIVSVIVRIESGRTGKEHSHWRDASGTRRTLPACAGGSNSIFRADGGDYEWAERLCRTWADDCHAASNIQEVDDIEICGTSFFDHTMHATTLVVFVRDRIVQGHHSIFGEEW